MSYTNRETVIRECVNITLNRRNAEILDSKNLHDNNVITEQEFRLVLRVYLNVTNLTKLNNELTDEEIDECLNYIWEQILYERS